MSPVTRTSPQGTGGPSAPAVSAQPAPTVLGAWSGHGSDVHSGQEALRDAIADIRLPLYVLGGAGGGSETSGPSIASRGEARFGTDLRLHDGDQAIIGHVAPLRLDSLGDPEFRRAHGLKLGCVAGAMANGIASVEMVEAMSHAGMLGIFGAAGLPTRTIEAAIDRLTSSLGSAPFGFNLIHSPNEPHLEHAVVDLYLRHGVRLVEASAYMRLTLPLIRYRVSGIYRDTDGRVVTPNRVIAKASRVEVATRFFSPPPEAFLQELVASGDITEKQARLAREIPVAQDLTAEADSGGHTDNRPALGLLPAMIALRDRLQREYGYSEALRVGAAGGIATPHAAAAAFAMGAAYIVTGSVNQSCVEAGTSQAVREMLATTEQADIAMAPAADMFEMGVKVQVLKRGTMFAMRAGRLYELYRTYESLDDIPGDEARKLEQTVFKASFAEVLEEVRTFFMDRDPTQWERAETDPKHRMALVFRWYLGLASHWANSGEPSRRLDYQIWCGPAMGAFNAWAQDTFLAEPGNRSVVTVSLNLLYGAAVLNRIQTLRSQGVVLSPEQQQVLPRTLPQLELHLP
jgi:trans-AT polyketide synthase, acyltransferase and oxidoreductase domains